MRSSAILALLVLASACSPRRQSEPASAAAALQSFYDTYLPVFQQGRSRGFLDDSTTLVSPMLRQDTALAAIAVLEQSSQGWSLVDLRYPGDTSTLQGILARLATDRTRP